MEHLNVNLRINSFHFYLKIYEKVAFHKILSFWPQRHCIHKFHQLVNRISCSDRPTPTFMHDPDRVGYESPFIITLHQHLHNNLKIQ